MTLKEKRDLLETFCDSYADCEVCPCKCDTDKSAWCNHTNVCRISEEELDIVLKKYNILPTGNDDQADQSDQHDPVSHPSHYCQGNIECIDAMLAAYGKEAVSTFCVLNAFKYLWRSEHKNGKEDLEKAIWYLKKRLELSESE